MSNIIMNITTIKELKKHIGEYLAFESHSGSQAGHRTYVWIQKLQKVGNKRDNIPLGESEIYHLPCYSLFSGQVYPYPKPYSGTYGNKNIYELYHTNAQDVIRTPTRDEMNKYRMMWRKFRILGHD